MRTPREPLLHSFSSTSPLLILVAFTLLACAGSTSVQREHHLLPGDSSMASVCFLRPQEGFMGVRGQPISIQLDGERLLDLSIGEYTFLDLRQGEYGMVVTSTTLEGPDNAMVETSRDFVLDLAGADSVYLLFTLEESDFWDMVNQSLSDQYDALTDKTLSQLDTIKIHFGEHVAILFTTESTPQRGYHPAIGYKVESVDRQVAMEVATELERVEGGH